MQTQQNYQTAAGAASQMAPVTVIHFVILALVAIMAVVIIIVGARLAHRRHKADAETVERQEVIEAAPATAPHTAPERPDQSVPPVPPATAVPPAQGDNDLTRLKGLGPRIAARLGELGVYSIVDMARLTDEGAATIDAELTPFQGRLSRDRWVEQARLLAAGDVAGFEAEFGKLG